MLIQIAEGEWLRADEIQRVTEVPKGAAISLTDGKMHKTHLSAESFAMRLAPLLPVQPGFFALCWCWHHREEVEAEKIEPKTFDFQSQIESYPVIAWRVLDGIVNPVVLDPEYSWGEGNAAGLLCPTGQVFDYNDPDRPYRQNMAAWIESARRRWMVALGVPTHG